MKVVPAGGLMYGGDIEHGLSAGLVSSHSAVFYAIIEQVTAGRAIASKISTL